MRTDARPMTECPCPATYCAVIGWKLQKNGHMLGCLCRSCLGRRNRRKGRSSQAKGHRLLGGTSLFTPLHEETAGCYDLQIQVEMKAGAQVPASFLRFTELDWTRRALSQAERAIPAGVQAFPSIYLDPPGRSGKWLVVKIA